MKAAWAFRLVAAVLASALAAPVFAADVKIGYVDLQRALNESEAGKRAKADFKVQVDKLEGQLKGKKDELDKLKDELDRKSVVMRDDERKRLEDDFQHKRLDLKRKFEDSQAELQKKDNELTGQIIQELQEIIRQIGDRDRYTLILEISSAPVLYTDKSSDLTDQVLTAYNAKKK
ncbi:MAG TPA: OmpH family outer membrane protein [Candidatus Bathyarchaeia archaeon]|nr:OmpH family outer membrane protein [Candidatus Bathyarchaeia archaeon]